MIIQLGNKEFNIGRINLNFSTYTRKIINQGTPLNYSQLVKWSNDTRYVLHNPPLSSGWTTFLTSNDIVNEWFAYPFFDTVIAGSNKTVYIVFYKVPAGDGPVNQYPVGAWCIGGGYLQNNQLVFVGTGLSQGNYGYYTYINQNDSGVVFYDEYNSTTGSYMNNTDLSTCTARASITTGIWQSGRALYNVGEEAPWDGTNTPNGKALIANNGYGLFGFNSDQISPPTGVELDLVDDPSSDAGGEDGTFYPYGDDIGYPDLPTVSGVSLGLVTLYQPSVYELTTFGQWLYNTPLDDTIIDTLKKLNTNIFDYIISVNLLPISTTSVTSSTFKMGPVDSKIATSRVLTQYIATPEYTKKIDEYYGGFQDYSPQTKVMLYLPFIGFKMLSTDDVMSGTIGIKYHIDLLTGDLVCFVKLYGKYTQSVIYEFSGNCASQVPLNGRDYSNIVRGAVQGAVQSATSLISGNIGGAAAQLFNTVTDIAMSKPTVERSGAIVANAGFLSSYTPYLIFARPAASHPQNYEKYKGRPSNITAQLSSLTGYTEVDELITSGFSRASQSEVEEIKSLLSSGIYL